MAAPPPRRIEAFALDRTLFRFAATLLLAFWGVACDGPGGAGGPDYLTPELRTAVEQLKLDVAARPTDETTVAARARILADWVDAYALGGGEVGLEGPRVRLQATSAPRGQAALAQGAVIDRLVRQFTLHDEPGALGALTAESLGPFEARSHQTIRQTWTVGTRPVVVGGGFWVARHFSVNSGPFQTEDPAGEGYTSIGTSDADATFETDVYMARGPHGGFRAPAPALVFRVASGQLDPGETVTITYGDRSGGGAGLLMTGTSSARMPLPLYVDLDASGEWRPLPLQPFVVVGSRVAGVHGFAPSIVAPGEPFELSIRAEDAFFNRATGDIPSFEVLVDGDVRATTPAGAEPITVVELALDDNTGCARADGRHSRRRRGSSPWRRSAPRSNCAVSCTRDGGAPAAIKRRDHASRPVHERQRSSCVASGFAKGRPSRAACSASRLRRKYHCDGRSPWPNCTMVGLRSRPAWACCSTCWSWVRNWRISGRATGLSRFRAGMFQ